MKTNYLKKQLKRLVCSSFLILIATASTVSIAGDRVGNGGDSVASHFYEIATRLSKVFNSICHGTEDDICEAKEDFQSLVLDKVTIYSEQTVEGVDARQRDAINNGKDSIVVSRGRWNQMELSLTRNEKRVRLVLHEYFSIMGLESSDNYSRSTYLVQKLKDSMFSIDSIAGKYERRKLKNSCAYTIETNSVKKSKIAKIMNAYGYEKAVSRPSARYSIKLVEQPAGVFVELNDILKRELIIFKAFSGCGDNCIPFAGISEKRKALNYLRNRLPECSNIENNH